MKGDPEGLSGAVADFEGCGGQLDVGIADWNSWATFSNQVSQALRDAGVEALFSKRRRVAIRLWNLGHRPTEPQIAAEVARQHNREDT